MIEPANAGFVVFGDKMCINKNHLANPHAHVNSLDSGSKIEDFFKREAELGGKYFSNTDHGFLGATMECLKYAKKYNINFIPGLEAYFRPSKCDVFEKHGISNIDKYLDNKYMHLTMHFKNEEAYQNASKILSKTYQNRSEVHGSELKPLFDWNDIEEICSKDVTLMSSCLVGLVGRHLMNNRPDLATAYYEKFRSLVKPGDFYVEVFPHDTSTYYANGVFITDSLGNKTKLRMEKKIRTDFSEQLTAQEAAKHFEKYGEFKITGIKNYHKWQDTEIIVKNMEAIEDFIQNDCTPEYPDGDIQNYVNKFVLDLLSGQACRGPG